jgi:cytochrome P450
MLDPVTIPPSPPLPTALQTLLWIRRPTELLQWCRDRYGAAFTLRLPPFHISLLCDPESIRAIFASKAEEMRAGEVNKVLRVLVGSSSVLVLDGPEHMRHRRLLMPSFHGERMRHYGAIMAEITRRSIATWPIDTPFALHPFTQDITLQVILRTVFGADEGAELTALSDQVKRMLAAADRPFSILPTIYMSTHPEVETRQPWRYLLRDRNRTDALLYAQIAARRAEGTAGGRKDVLSMLLQARDEDGVGMTDRELRDELMTALAAGHETTATALAWAFERILPHGEIHARLREEVRAAGGVDADPEKIAALPYLDATIKEVLRLRPIVPVVGRVLQKPCTLGGFDLPAGATVGACIYLAQRDPDVYPEPHAFRPERWLGVQPDPASWLPFGGGIRRCVGAQFALYEMKIVLATILASCDLELAQPAPARVVRRAITFWPEGGTRIRMRGRARMAG